MRFEGRAVWYDVMTFRRDRPLLRKMCPYSELFWTVFSGIQPENGLIQSISPYSVRMQENPDQKNSEYGHFSRSAFNKDAYFFNAHTIYNALDFIGT